ncbi:histone deacetylase [Marinicellulosiphila megalodicopiae]|uniref:histone deacetylase family protein n=1 Tax=Marinicellulosiphila megalodicopiae TaxID=2724896 RepID=UPI003BB1744D
MEKFKLLNQYLTEKNIVTPSNTFRPGKARLDFLQLAHCPDYLHRFINNLQSKQEVRRMGLPWSEGLLNRTLISPNGTFLTALLALDHGIACHLAGGTHHANYDFASGFCILNDLALSARAIILQGKVNKVLIVDCDVHQGDGTASILQNDDDIFTFSMHCEKNFPVRKAHSNLDIGLDVGLKDQAYLDTLEHHLLSVIRSFKPDFIFYDAGVDIYEHDPLGLLNISLKGIEDRDRLVLDICKQFNIPVATVIGGGYDDDRMALAKRHALVVEAAQDIYKI